jgi:hypothetical protein
MKPPRTDTVLFVAAALSSTVIAALFGRFAPPFWRDSLLVAGFAAAIAVLKLLRPQNAFVSSGSWLALAFATVVVTGTSIAFNLSPFGNVGR